MTVWRFHGHTSGSTIQETGLPTSSTFTVTDIVLSVERHAVGGLYFALTDDVNGGAFEMEIYPDGPLAVAGLTNGPELSTGTNGRIQVYVTTPNDVSYPNNAPELYYYVAGTTP